MKDLCVSASDADEEFWMSTKSNGWVVGVSHLGDLTISYSPELDLEELPVISSIEEQVADQFEKLMMDFIQDVPNAGDEDIDLIVTLLSAAMEYVEEAVDESNQELAAPLLLSFIQDIFTETRNLVGVSYPEAILKLESEAAGLMKDIEKALMSPPSADINEFHYLNFGGEEISSDIPAVVITPRTTVELEALRTLVYDATEKGHERAAEWADQLESFKEWRAKNK